MLLCIRYFIKEDMPKEIMISDKKSFEKKVPKPPEATSIENKDIPIVEQTTKKVPIPPPVGAKNEKLDQKKNEKKEKIKKVKKERKPLKKWMIVSIVVGSILLVGGGLFSFYYFGIFKFVKSPSEVTDFPTDYLKPSTQVLPFEETIKLLQPEKPRTEESPLNGELFTIEDMKVMMKRRPVAVMMNNHVIARPQSGLNSADLVFEALVESGITRYLVIFWSDAPEKVGPVRSTRNYHLQWLNPLDA